MIHRESNNTIGRIFKVWCVIAVVVQELSTAYTCTLSCRDDVNNDDDDFNNASGLLSLLMNKKEWLHSFHNMCRLATNRSLHPTFRIAWNVLVLCVVISYKKYLKMRHTICSQPLINHWSLLVPMHYQSFFKQTFFQLTHCYGLKMCLVFVSSRWCYAIVFHFLTTRGWEQALTNTMKSMCW